MAIKEDLEARSSQLAEAANTGDVEKVCQLYTEDALLMLPGSPQVQGPAAIKAYWERGIDAGVRDVTFTCHEAVEAGDIAIDIGALFASVPTEGGARTTFVGKYIVIWTKGDDGDWYLHRDIWNFDA